MSHNPGALSPRLRRMMGIGLFLLAPLAALILSQAPSSAGFLAQATTYAYAQGASSGVNCPLVAPGAEATGCSLARALVVTQAGGTIILETSGRDASYVGGLTITQNVTIEPGTGVTSPTIDGRGTTKLITVSDGITLTMSGITLTNGYDLLGGGGAIQAYNGDHLILSNMIISTNHAWGGGAINLASGSGSTGSLEITDSTVSGNTSANEGAAIDAANYGGTATVKILRSTFANNTGPYSGGAVSVGANAGSVGTLEVRQSTFVGNKVSQNGGALSVGSYGGSASAVIVNSDFIENGWNAIGVGGDVFMAGNLIANSVAYSTNTGENCTSPVTDGGYNLEWGTGDVSATSCGFGGTATNHDPLLGSLADNGGVTQTLLPGASSPLLRAIPAGSSVNTTAGTISLCEGPDQRGVLIRSGQPCAIGSVQPVLTQPTLVSLVANSDGSITATWEPGPGPAGLPIEHYTVTLSPGGANCTTVTTTCTIRGLQPLTSYSATVVATNAAGDSSPSNQLTAATTLAATGSLLGLDALLGIGSIALGIMLLLGIRGRRTTS